MNHSNSNGNGRSYDNIDPRVAEAHAWLDYHVSEIATKILLDLWPLSIDEERKLAVEEGDSPEGIDANEVVFLDEDMDVLEEVVEDWTEAHLCGLFADLEKILRGSVFGTQNLGGNWLSSSPDQYWTSDLNNFFESWSECHRSKKDRPWHKNQLWQLPARLTVFVLRWEVLLKLAIWNNYDPNGKWYKGLLRHWEQRSDIRRRAIFQLRKKEEDLQKQGEFHRGQSARFEKVTAAS